jgi:hypothetical protein
MMDLVQQYENLDIHEIMKDYEYHDFLRYWDVMLKETMLRFPDTAAQDRLDWYLARWEGKHGYADVITTPGGGGYFTNPVAYLALLLENGLNLGTIRLDSLDKDLDALGFTLQERHTTTGLFRDGQPAEVLLIGGAGIRCALLAIDGSRPGDSRLFPVHPLWQHECHRDSEALSVDDRNGNGLSEIQTVIASRERLGCSSELALYEWDDTLTEARFTNIASNIQPVYLSGNAEKDCAGLWRFGPRDQGTLRPLIKTENLTNWAGEYCLPYQIQTRYEWNGARYEQTDEQVVPYDSTQPAECAVGWASVAAEQGLYDWAIDVLTVALQNWPAAVDDVWGPASKDYFRFKMGTWYAQQGQAERARATMLSVQDSPSNPDLDTVPKLAQSYLDHYEMEDPYPACLSAIYLAHSISNETRGFDDPAWNRFFYAMPEYRVCDIDAAENASLQELVQSLRALTPESTEALEQWFDERNIPIWAIEPMDFTGDGRDDWLVFVGHSGHSSNGQDDWLVPYGYGSNAGNGLWILVAGPSGLAAKQVTYYAFAGTPISLGHFVLAQDGTHVVSVIEDDTLALFRIAIQPDAIQTERLFGRLGVSSYEVDSVNGETELLLHRTSGAVERYVWDPDGTYEWFSQPAEIEKRNRTTQARKTIESIEQAFFPAGDIPQMRALLHVFFAEDQLAGTDLLDYAEYPARMLYLFGLAHELTGDEESAIEAYWELWSKYPESPFVLIVRRKLEPVGDR